MTYIGKLDHRVEDGIISMTPFLMPVFMLDPQQNCQTLPLLSTGATEINPKKSLCLF